MVSLPVCEGVTSCGHGIAGHLQSGVSRGSPAWGKFHPWVGARELGTTGWRGSWRTLAMQPLLPVGRRASSCGVSPWISRHCVPRRAGLGWEHSSAHCVSPGAFPPYLTFPPKKVLCLCLPRPGLTELPQTCAMTFPAGIPSLDEAVSPCAQAVPALPETEL